MSHGALTAHVARSLAGSLSDRPVDVLFDHGEQGVDPPQCLGEIVSWYGTHYGATACLALLDIAVVRQESDQAVALIEIEESAAPPKVLLGDAFATLLGDHITFQGNHALEVGKWTTLIVLVHAAGEGKQQQVAELAHRVREVKPFLTSGNASIGHILIDTFADADELEKTVTQLVIPMVRPVSSTWRARPDRAATDGVSLVNQKHATQRQSTCSLSVAALSCASAQQRTSATRLAAS